MPRRPPFPLDYRPDLFSGFDGLLHDLHHLVPHVATRAEIQAALELEGRQLDIDALALELQLDAPVVELVRRLASFGDEGEAVHEYASVILASINAGSLVGMVDLTTYVLATRRGTQVDVWWKDENGGTGQLGVRAQVPSFLEVTMLIDAVLIAQAPYPVTDGDWRTGYLCDDTTVVGISSIAYAGLRAYYRSIVRDWERARSRKEA